MPNVSVRGVVVLGLLTVTAARAEAEGGKPLASMMDATLGVVYATSSTKTSTGTLSSSAYGVEARMSGSLLATLGSAPDPHPGLRLQDWWSLNFGAGYVDAGNGAFVDFRLEATLRASYLFNPDFEMFTRAGYLTGTSAASGSFRGYDALFVTGGGRLGRLFGEAGLGVNGTDDRGYYYLLGSLEYRARADGFFQYVGVRAEAFPSRNGSNQDDLTILLTAGSH